MARNGIDSSVADVHEINIADTFTLADSTSLLSGWSWGINTGAPITLTYSFPGLNGASAWRATDYSTKDEWSDWTALSSLQAAYVEQALAVWESISMIDFVRVDETSTQVGDLRFAFSSTVPDENAAYAYYPSSLARGGDVWIKSKYINGDFSPEGALFVTVLHEIGHAIGLKHPHETSTDNDNTLSTTYDSLDYTVMTYNLDGYYSNSRNWPTAPGWFDDVAVDLLYGGNSIGAAGSAVTPTSVILTGSATTDSLSGGSGGDRITGLTGADVLSGSAGHDWLDGGAGSDTISGGDGSDTILGGPSSSGGEADNDSIDSGDGNDLIYAYDGEDWIFSGLGNDTVYTGIGNDTLLGGRGTDYIYGGQGDDSILPGQDADTVESGLGNDTVLAGQGDDVVLAGKGDDYVLGALGNDSLNGALGNDTLDGNDGNDTLVGGGGADLFMSTLPSGRDRIEDFSISEGDHIMITARTTYTVGTYTVSGVVAGAMLTFSGSNYLLLKGLSKTDVTSSIFIVS